MTWAFAYAAALVVGLALASVTGLIRDLRSLARHHLVVPHPDQQSAFLALLGRRLAVGLVFAGIVGLVMGARRISEPRITAMVSFGVGLVGFVVALAALRRPCPAVVYNQKATVVRDIPPGGYGQVRLQRVGGSVVMAAQNVDEAVIPAGSEVEVVDCTRSVVTIRLQNQA